MAFGRLDPNATGYVQASGESTPQMVQPEKFIPSARSTNAINDSVRIPPDWNGNTRRQPIVQRAARTVGMKYLYVRGASPQPVHPAGADGVPVPWTSGFQKNYIGFIHNCGFDWAHFQAGYPGFNLGLSFKVPSLPQSNTAVQSVPRPGQPFRATGPKSAKGGSRGTFGVQRAIGRRSV